MSPAAIRKDLRRRFRGTGSALLLYYGIMNLIAVGAGVGIGLDMGKSSMAVINEAMGFCYLVATTLGLLILFDKHKKGTLKGILLWEKRTMKPISFMKILCVFLSVQLGSFILNTIVEMLLNSMGYSMFEALEQSQSDSFTMYLYASISAPVTEELLFRGLLLRYMRPYGRKFAILTSAFMFGIFHGNFTQIPFAFIVGLILGYVALEYNITWAMVLHMINNLLLADGLNRITFHMSEGQSTLIFLAIIFAFAVAAVVILIVDRKKIAAYLKPEPINKLCVQAFFSTPNIIIMILISLFSAWFMITPI